MENYHKMEKIGEGQSYCDLNCAYLGHGTRGGFQKAHTNDQQEHMVLSTKLEIFHPKPIIALLR